MIRALAVLTVASLLGPAAALASGHGPVYGLATPTLTQRGWTYDQAWMARVGDDGTGQMTRGMISFGVTEDFQLSGSVPVVLVRAPAPAARQIGMMGGTRDVEAMAAWRFHRRATGVGSRFESTAYLGFTIPSDEARAGVRTDPGVYAAVATGYASRSHYFWVGVGH